MHLLSLLSQSRHFTGQLHQLSTQLGVAHVLFPTISFQSFHVQQQIGFIGLGIKKKEEISGVSKGAMGKAVMMMMMMMMMMIVTVFVEYDW